MDRLQQRLGDKLDGRGTRQLLEQLDEYPQGTPCLVASVAELAALYEEVIDRRAKMADEYPDEGGR